MSHEFLALVRRLETAQGLQNERFNLAAGGTSLAVGGGFAHRRGDGHPLNQALGLVGPVSEADLESAEAFLGSPTVLELSPGADPALWPLLSKRGYRVHQFQQLLTRDLSGDSPEDPAVDVRIAAPQDADRYSRIVAAGFQERDDWPEVEQPFSLTLDLPDAWGFLVFSEGAPAGGGMLALAEGVALLSGDGVLPRFRGRGFQKALIRARLRFAFGQGCGLACASTLPGTPSQRAYESCGFRVAYPKVEMVKDGG
jgi:GNAT superfamily N-acetyltransferase